ncbi:transport system permease [Anopheles sinensis]|uniref:Transport system permease n=1 Tax=Anopheles sinensis TaxID=74873 RepID=A0A084VSS4_ANOSI|nr:transport system permease [Anopheles sinensis]
MASALPNRGAEGQHVRRKSLIRGRNPTTPDLPRWRTGSAGKLPCSRLFIVFLLAALGTFGLEFGGRLNEAHKSNRPALRGPGFMGFRFMVLLPVDHRGPLAVTVMVCDEIDFRLARVAD